MRGACCLVLWFWACCFARGEEPLTNSAVLELVREGVPDSAILTLIETRPAKFDTSVKALIALKQAGVSEAIITAVASRVRPAQAKAAAADIPDELGLYAKVRDRHGQRLVPLRTELITWRTGGVLKSLPGMLGSPISAKGHLNGVLSGPASGARLSPPLEIVLRCAAGIQVEEYQLLRFWEKSNRREFRIATGGVIHASGGADINVISFEAQKLAPGLYRIVIRDLRRGEYGFLPPGAALSASAASSGKMYTFGTE